MKTQYYTATSLDGFIATEDDSLEWLFPLGDVNETSYPTFIAARRFGSFRRGRPERGLPSCDMRWPASQVGPDIQCLEMGLGGR